MQHQQDEEDDTGTLKFGADGFQGFSDEHFYCFFGNIEFFGDLGIAFMLFPAQFKHEPALFGECFDDAVDILLQKFRGDGFFDMVFVFGV